MPQNYDQFFAEESLRDDMPPYESEIAPYGAPPAEAGAAENENSSDPTFLSDEEITIEPAKPEVISAPAPDTAPYVSVPARTKREVDAAHLLTPMDKLNLWTAIAAMIFTTCIIMYKAEWVAKTNKAIIRFAFPILAILLLSGIFVFEHPLLFGTGTPGSLSFIALAEFSAAATALGLAFPAAMQHPKTLKPKRMPHIPVARFVSVKYLIAGFAVLMLSMFLLLLFTESSIAIFAIFVLSAAATTSSFYKRGIATNARLSKYLLSSIGTGIALIGSLSGIFVLALAGAAIAGTGLIEPPQPTQNRQEHK